MLESHKRSGDKLDALAELQDPVQFQQLYAQNLPQIQKDLPDVQLPTPEAMTPKLARFYSGLAGHASETIEQALKMQQTATSAAEAKKAAAETPGAQAESSIKQEQYARIKSFGANPQKMLDVVDKLTNGSPQVNQSFRAEMEAALMDKEDPISKSQAVLARIGDYNKTRAMELDPQTRAAKLHDQEAAQAAAAAVNNSFEQARSAKDKYVSVAQAFNQAHSAADLVSNFLKTAEVNPVNAAQAGPILQNLIGQVAGVRGSAGGDKELTSAIDKLQNGLSSIQGKPITVDTIEDLKATVDSVKQAAESKAERDRQSLQQTYAGTKLPKLRAYKSYQRNPVTGHLVGTGYDGKNYDYETGEPVQQTGPITNKK
jgi:hypothetical protein